jgi:inorganic pyrophosphatase
MRKQSVFILVAIVTTLYYSIKQRVSNRGFDLRQEGQLGSQSFRVFLTRESRPVSFWHDLPLMARDGAVNMVVEIPRLSREKMEIHKTEISNPLFQDTRQGKLRFLHAPLSWHYGSVPQTLGDDGDPIDILDVSDSERVLGQIVPMKIIGALPLLDDDKLDWKIVAIAADDELSNRINTLSDLENLKPGVISGITEFFRWYDFPETKKPNVYAGDILDVESTWSLISGAHAQWRRVFTSRPVVN